MFNRMKIYTVHVKPESITEQRPVFVREGFNPFAFVFSLFWLVYKRLWLPALAVLLLDLLIIFLLRNHILAHHSIVFLDLALHLMVAFHANDWLRSRLQKKGYIMADISAADSLLRAEQRYFERYLAAAAS